MTLHPEVSRRTLWSTETGGTGVLDAHGVLYSVCCTTMLYFGSEMSPQVPHVKGLVPNVVVLGGDESFMRWGLEGGLCVFGSVPEKEMVGPSPFFLFFPSYCYQDSASLQANPLWSGISTKGAKINYLSLSAKSPAFVTVTKTHT